MIIHGTAIKKALESQTVDPKKQCFYCNSKNNLSLTRTGGTNPPIYICPNCYKTLSKLCQ